MLGLQASTKKERGGGGGAGGGPTLGPMLKYINQPIYRGPQKGGPGPPGPTHGLPFWLRCIEADTNGGGMHGGYTYCSK